MMAIKFCNFPTVCYHSVEITVLYCYHLFVKIPWNQLFTKELYSNWFDEKMHVSKSLLFPVCPVRSSQLIVWKNENFLMTRELFREFNFTVKLFKRLFSRIFFSKNSTVLFWSFYIPLFFAFYLHILKSSLKVIR